MKKLPTILLTMGDPAGVGPEIAVKALCNPALNKNCRVVVVGDFDVMQHAASVLSLSPDFNVIQNIEDVYNIDSNPPPLINILDMKQVTMSQFEIGKPQAICGRAAYQYIIKAIELTLEKKADAVVTCPISKESLSLANINYPGHTEIFADKTNTQDYSMVFLQDGVAVAHVTTHVSLCEAIKLITKERVLAQIKLLHRSLKMFGITSPRIAVGGLNPHAGENGLFGNEEIREINPAIVEARNLGIDVVGALPPDTVFVRAFKGEFNGVVSMLHDHGFVALKSRDFEHGVNVTIGLPIIRTSVGHGTAFDKAYKGVASCESLLSAIDVAVNVAGK